MVSKRILTFGFSCRALVQCAESEGFEVTTFDRCGDADTRVFSKSFQLLSPDASYVEQVMNQNDIEQYPYILFSGGIESDLSQFNPTLQPDRPAFLSQPWSEMRSLNNWELWANKAGLLFPETRPLKTDTHDETSIENSRYLIKDLQSAGGLSVAWYNHAIPHMDTRYVQQYIEGSVFGVTFLTAPSLGMAVGCAEAWPHRQHPWGPFVFHGCIGPTSLHREEWKCMDRFAEAVNRSTNWTGIWGADFIRSDHGIYLLEINPRWTSSMELIAASLNVPLIQLHCKAKDSIENEDARLDLIAMSEELRDRRKSNTKPIGKRIVYADTHREVSRDQLQAWLQEGWRSKPIENNRIQFADIPYEPTIFEPGFPICSLFSTGECNSSLVSYLDDQVEALLARMRDGSPSEYERIDQNPRASQSELG